MVENIKGFGPKLKLQSFMNRKLAPHCKVHLLGRKAAQEVPRGIAEVSRCDLRRSRNHEGVEVYSPSARGGCVADIDRLAGHEVSPKRDLRSCCIKARSTAYVERQG